jgi:uncharacterized membrane protein YdbT with pleckstrin-like domain
MAEKVPQTFANHTRFDPLYHFFTLPVMGITLIAVIVHAVRWPTLWSVWMIVVMAAVVTAVLKIRLYALRVQDRLIRLEERLRLAGCIEASLRPRIAEFTETQLIGLRFASDSELPALAARALEEKLSRDDIKKAVRQWRPDHWRV